MKIADLVNKVEPFRFEYDGFVLEGEWYKYRTTTPEYAKKLVMPEVPETASIEDKIAAARAGRDALESFLHQGLADMIISWNAEDEHGPIQPCLEVFQRLPEPFTSKLAGYFRDLREGKNPTSPNSSST